MGYADPKGALGRNVESPGAYQFKVEIEGENIEYRFKSCTGLKWESKVEAYQEGGDNASPRKLLSFGDYPPIVLKQGMIGGNTALWKRRQQWIDDQAAGQPSGQRWETPRRFNGTITQLTKENTPESKWHFEGAWISKWEGPDFDATKQEVSVESIEIIHERLEMVPGALTRST